MVLDKGAQDVVIVDMRNIDSEVSAFLVCHGKSRRKVKAISEESPGFIIKQESQSKNLQCPKNLIFFEKQKNGFWTS